MNLLKQMQTNLKNLNISAASNKTVTMTLLDYLTDLSNAKIEAEESAKNNYNDQIEFNNKLLEKKMDICSQFLQIIMDDTDFYLKHKEKFDELSTKLEE